MFMYWAIHSEYGRASIIKCPIAFTENYGFCLKAVGCSQHKQSDATNVQTHAHTSQTIMLLCKKKVNFRCAWLFMFLPFTSYLLGFIVYCAISDISGIKDVNSPNSGLDPKNFTWEGGMIFAVIIIILMSANLGHGMLFTRKYLTISNTPNNQRKQ